MGFGTNVAAWQHLGEALSLHIRDVDSSEPRRVNELLAVENLGLNGDRHAHPLSPRQVLLAGSDVYRDLGLKSKTLRENLLLSFSTHELESSNLLKVGKDVVLWLTFQCEACGHLERRHPGVVKLIKGRRGMLARVLRGGTISPGDEVQCAPSSIIPISNRWQDRISCVLHRVPPGKRVEFRQLALLAGVPKVYCRAFPKIISQLPPSVAGKAQTGDVLAVDERWSGSELFNVTKNLGGDATLNQ